MQYFQKCIAGLKMDQRAKPGMVLLAGNSHPSLTEDIASHLGVSVGSCLVYHNTNRFAMQSQNSLVKEQLLLISCVSLVCFFDIFLWP